MKTNINGITFEGTVDEIIELTKKMSQHKLDVVVPHIYSSTIEKTKKLYLATLNDVEKQKVVDAMLKRLKFLKDSGQMYNKNKTLYDLSTYEKASVLCSIWNKIGDYHGHTYDDDKMYFQNTIIPPEFDYILEFYKNNIDL